jgi:hypothetical protein
VLAPTSYVLTGASATTTATRNLLLSPTNYTISGFAATTLRTYSLDAQPGSFALTGADATLTYVRKITLSADGGSLTITGSPATLTYAPKTNSELLADPGSFSITGASATLLRTYVVNAQQTVYEVNGAPATLASTRIFNAQNGTFSVVGADATLDYASPNRILNAGVGAFDILGQPATLEYARTLYAAPATLSSSTDYVTSGYVTPGYVTSGDMAGLTAQRVLQAGPTSIVLTGYAATLTKASSSVTINAAQIQMLTDIWQRLGLDTANALIESDASATFGSVTLTKSGSDTIITTRSGTNPANDDVSTVLLDIWQRLGLDPVNPLTVTSGTITAGGVSQTRVETSTSSVTVTRL